MVGAMLPSPGQRPVSWCFRILNIQTLWVISRLFFYYVVLHVKNCSKIILNLKKKMTMLQIFLPLQISLTTGLPSGLAELAAETR